MDMETPQWLYLTYTRIHQKTRDRVRWRDYAHERATRGERDRALLWRGRVQHPMSTSLDRPSAHCDTAWAKQGARPEPVEMIRDPVVRGHHHPREHDGKRPPSCQFVRGAPDGRRSFRSAPQTAPRQSASSSHSSISA